MRKKFIVLTMVLILSIPILGLGYNREIYEKVARATLKIFMSYTDKEGQSHQGFGTGVYLGNNLVLSVSHALLVANFGANNDKFWILDKNGKQAVLRVEKLDGEVMTTPHNDGLALFSFRGEINATPIEVADKMVIGDEIYYGGYSSTLYPLIRLGYLMKREDTGIYLEHVDFGDSGGGVFDSHGRLIGIIWLVWSRASIVTSAYAIPLDKIQKFLGIEHGN